MICVEPRILICESASFLPNRIIPSFARHRIGFAHCFACKIFRTTVCSPYKRAHLIFGRATRTNLSFYFSRVFREIPQREQYLIMPMREAGYKENQMKSEILLPPAFVSLSRGPISLILRPTTTILTNPRNREFATLQCTE